MLMPAIAGVMKRRLLVNYRADPDVVQRLLPEPFEPKLYKGKAIVGICLIRLEKLRPAAFPALITASSENAAHRIGVTWTDEMGGAREGVFVLRRDSNSWVNHRTGGRLFPGVHHRADFDISDDGARVELKMRARDGEVSVEIAGDVAEFLPKSSLFESLAAASAYFEAGGCGFSPGLSHGKLDGMELRVQEWKVAPFSVLRARSSVFEDAAIFPDGSIEFDHALVMRDIQHVWRRIEASTLTGSLSAKAETLIRHPSGASVF